MSLGSPIWKYRQRQVIISSNSSRNYHVWLREAKKVKISHQRYHKQSIRLSLNLSNLRIKVRKSICQRQVRQSRKERIKNANADLKRFLLCILIIECPRRFKNRLRREQVPTKTPHFLCVWIRMKLGWFVWVSNANSTLFSAPYVRIHHVKLLTNMMINLFLLVTSSSPKEFWRKGNRVSLWPMQWTLIVKYWKNWKKM